VAGHPRREGPPGKVATGVRCGMEERACTGDGARAHTENGMNIAIFEKLCRRSDDGKTWMPQHAQSMKQAKMLAQGFVRDYPAQRNKGLTADGAVGRWQDTLGGSGLKELIRRGHAGLFLRLS